MGRMCSRTGKPAHPGQMCSSMCGPAQSGSCVAGLMICLSICLLGVPQTQLFDGAING